MPQSDKKMDKSKKLSAAAVVVLVVVTAGIYWQTTRQGFSIVDDGDYTYSNPWVNQGVSWEAARWAFTTFFAANWHPLTWLVHQVDWSLYGSFAGGHHLTNLLLHTANTVMLFLLLRSLTGSAGRSWIVAALFGWHPLHVESVAWIAELKDLLCAAFWLATIWAYARYARESKDKDPKGKIYYGLAIVFFICGLMSKPMMVTLPFVLLLLDYWPLARIYDLRFRIDESKAGEGVEEKGVSLIRAMVEKVPFLALAAGSCLATLLAQHAGGAVKNTSQVSLVGRMLNCLSTYAVYVRQSIWPHPLCIFYPIPAHHSLIALLLGALLLFGLTLLATVRRHRSPWLFTGWLWFVGSLVPVVGLVQVGLQAHADRYMYIPSIGLFIVLVWGVDQLICGLAGGRKIAIGLAGASLAGCVVLSFCQLQYWQDSVTLFTHALAHTENNAFSQSNLGAALGEAGKSLEAIPHFRKAAELEPANPRLQYVLGNALAAAGDLEGAKQAYRGALRMVPHNAMVLNDLGVVLAQQGKSAEALTQFREAIQWNPGYPKSYVNAGIALEALGEPGPAVTNYTIALKMEPGSLLALDHLAYLLATCPVEQYHNPAAAIQLAGRTVEITQNKVPGYLQTLAIAYAAAGQYSNAVVANEKALQISREHAMPELAGRLEKELTAYRAGRSPEWNWKQSP